MNIKIKFKKLLSFVLAGTLVLSLAACGNSSSSNNNTQSETTSKSAQVSKHKKFKIAVLEVQLNDESTNRAKYFKEYIAPRYNVEFMFSEAISTLDAAITFVENASDAGADAIINYYAIGANSEKLTQLCKEKNMVLVENGGVNQQNLNAFNGGYENYLGGFMADQPATGKLFYDYLKSSMKPENNNGFLINTGMAYQGNAQQIEVSTSMLKAISEIYGLTYKMTIKDLISSSSPIMAENDKNIAIYCYPGGTNIPGYLEGLSAALQTGKYNYALFSSNNLGKVETAIGEVEQAKNMDITFIGFGSFGAALKNALTAKDKFGNTTLSMSTVKFTSLVSAMAFAKVYNALTGYSNSNKDEKGNASMLYFTMQAVTSAEQLSSMEKWDIDGSWVADYGFVDSLLGDFNKDITNKDIQDKVYAVTYDSIKQRLG